jgi:A/G-specific adenine glycosylase
MQEFSQSVLSWFAEHGRKDLPWQENKTPYRIWISEIMLQQTQVATVIPYYLRFIQSFPNIKVLANAPIEHVLNHWSGLGYYARARNLHKTSMCIEERYDGLFPLDFDILISMPGIGRSTAGAILALADNQRFAILDGNVRRVLARFHAVEGWPGKKKVENLLWDIALEHLPKSNLASYTQAMMDLGATICTRSKPKCSDCPLRRSCIAHDRSEEEIYPFRKKSSIKPHRILYLVMLICGGKVLLEERPPTGIWGGLCSLPELLEKNSLNQWCIEHLGYFPKNIHQRKGIHHAFSHYSLDMRPIEVRIDDSFSKVKLRSKELWHTINAPTEFGVAAPIEKLLKSIH